MTPNQDGSTSGSSFQVRTATEADADIIIDLITELAVYEKMADQVKITAEDLTASGLYNSRTGSGNDARDPRWFHAKVAAVVDSTGEKEVVGYSIYFFRFDLLQQTSVVYMEDLYVRPAFRGKGIGVALWRSVAEHGLQQRCDELHFSVLAWNQPAIDFYERVGARDRTRTDGIHVYRLCQATIEQVASSGDTDDGSAAASAVAAGKSSFS